MLLAFPTEVNNSMSMDKEIQITWTQIDLLIATKYINYIRYEVDDEKSFKRRLILSGILKYLVNIAACKRFRN